MFNEEWSQYFNVWLLGAHAAGLKGEGENSDWYLYETPEIKEALKAKVLSYRCLPAQSAFTRGFEELKAEGLHQVRQPRPAEPDEPELTAEAYFRLPAAEVRRRFHSDLVFRASVQRLLDAKLI